MITAIILISVVLVCFISYYLYVQIFFVKTANEIYSKCNENPYTFTITNTKDVELRAVLFGCDKYQYCENYGSGDGIKTVSFPFNNYKDVLLQSKNMPFRSSSIKLVCSNDKQITKLVEFFYQDADGCSTTMPIIPIFKNTDFNRCVVNVSDLKFKIDGKSSFLLNILPNETIQVTIFSDDKIEKSTLFFQIKKDIINLYKGIIYYKKRKENLLSRIKSSI